MEISQTQNDTLRETMNIAVGRAANSLESLIDTLIQLEVPEVYIASPAEVEVLIKRIAGIEDGVTISQDITGPVVGRVGLYFSMESANTLLQILWGGASRDPKSFSLEEQSVLEEVANILLNGAISAIADLLDETIQLSLPTVMMSDASSGYAQWIARSLDPGESAFIIVAAVMVVEDESIQGLIILSLAVLQIKELLEKLE